MQAFVKYSMALQLAVAAVAVAQAQDARDRDMTDKDRMVDTTLLDKKVPQGAIRASTLIGTEVYNRQGKHLGEIKDVVLNSDQKKIGYVVLSYGGIAGLGDKLFALPRHMIQYSPAESKAYVDADEQVLRNAPGFDKNKWPTDATSAEYFRSLDTYYKEHGTARVGTDQDKALPAAGQINVDRDYTKRDRGEMATWDRRASALIGANVENTAGDNLGEVKDLVLDWGSGNVRYAVLSYGGILGIGDKLFAVPVDAFSSKPNSSKLILNVNKDQLKNAPGFSKDQWPNMADPQWSKSVDEFYKVNRIDTTR